MKSGSSALRLRIFIEESLERDGKPLYETLVHLARREGLAGATVFHGIEGYGKRRHLHTSRVVDASDNLPVVVEIIDMPAAIRRFAASLDGVIEHGTATASSVEIVKYSPGKPK